MSQALAPVAAERRAAPSLETQLQAAAEATSQYTRVALGLSDDYVKFPSDLQPVWVPLCVTCNSES